MSLSSKSLSCYMRRHLYTKVMFQGFFSGLITYINLNKIAICPLMPRNTFIEAILPATQNKMFFKTKSLMGKTTF